MIYYNNLLFSKKFVMINIITVMYNDDLNLKGECNPFGINRHLPLLRKKAPITACTLINTVLFTFLFILFYLDIELSHPLLYLVFIAYFLISSIGTYILYSILENKNFQKLKESEERYKNLVENHPDGIVIHDHYTILYGNPAIHKLLGYKTGSANGLSILKFTLPSNHEMLAKRHEDVYLEDQELIEIELLHRDGTSIFVESKAILCQYNNKTCVQVVMRDITERKNSEELLRASDKLAVVGQLAAGIAHEIRNPLTSIKGFVQVMRETSVSKQYYDVILTEIDRINQVTSDFLLLAKPQEKNLKKNNLLHILNDITSLLQPEALLHNVKLELVHDKKEVFLSCDINELKQAFINMVKNSIEAMPFGGEILIHLVETDNQISITIEDTGNGIPKEHLPNIGQPFYTLKENGTGLGLVTTIRIIENNGGTFKINSDEGQGTTISIVFPK